MYYKRHAGSWTIEEAKSWAKVYRYTLISHTWEGSREVYEFISPSGFKWSCSWDNFFNTYRRCPDEARIAYYVNNIKPYFDRRGCEILLDAVEYTGQFQRFMFRCSLGNHHITCWNNAHSNNGLCKCIKHKESYIEARDIIKNKGGRILESRINFPDVDTKFRFKCGNGHVCNTTLTALRVGVWCMDCHIENKRKLMLVERDLPLYKTASKKICKYEKVFKVTSEGLELLGVKCKKCNIIFIPSRNSIYERLGSVSGKRRGNNYFYCSDKCKYSDQNYNSCMDGGSKFEKQVAKVVRKTYIGEVLRNHRGLLTNPYTNRPLELDILFPECNKAIECNGTYWHNLPKVLQRDKIKHDLCVELGINLLVIWEDVWYSKNSYEKYILVNKFLEG